jgi:hypothetical protein
VLAPDVGLVSLSRHSDLRPSLTDGVVLDAEVIRLDGGVRLPPE